MCGQSVLDYSKYGRTVIYVSNKKKFSYLLLKKNEIE